MAGIYKYVLVRRAAAYSIITIYQVKLLCCETSQGVYVTKNETVIERTEQQPSEGSSMHPLKTGSSIAQTTPKSSSYIFFNGTKERETLHKKTKTSSSFIGTTDAQVRGTTTYLFTYSGSFLAIDQVGMYLYVRIDVLEKLTKCRKQQPPQGDDASTVYAATCRVGRGEQGEAHPTVSAPRGGPNVDLGRLRLKTWSQSDFSIDGTTWVTLYSMHLYVHA